MAETSTKTNGEKLTIIEERTANMAKDIEELICTVKSEVQSRTSQWLEYKVEHQKLVSRVDEHDIDISAITKDVRDIKKEIAPLTTWHKVLVGVVSFFGLSVGGLIWGILTHAITIVSQ